MEELNISNLERSVAGLNNAHLLIEHMQNILWKPLKLKLPGDTSATSEMLWYHFNSWKQGRLKGISHWRYRKSTKVSWLVNLMCQLTTSMDYSQQAVVADFISLASKIVRDGNCSYEIKTNLLLGGTVKLWSSAVQRHCTYQKGMYYQAYCFLNWNIS